MAQSSGEATKGVCRDDDTFFTWKGISKMAEGQKQLRLRYIESLLSVGIRCQFFDLQPIRCRWLVAVPEFLLSFCMLSPIWWQHQHVVYAALILGQPASGEGLDLCISSTASTIGFLQPEHLPIAWWTQSSCRDLLMARLTLCPKQLSLGYSDWCGPQINSV